MASTTYKRKRGKETGLRNLQNAESMTAALSSKAESFPQTSAIDEALFGAELKTGNSIILNDLNSHSSFQLLMYIIFPAAFAGK